MKNLILTLALLVPGTAFAGTTLFTLSPYNGFVFGNFSDTSDFGGGIAAGGSLTIGNTAVGSNFLGELITDFPSQYSLVAGGTLTATNGSVYAGNVYGGGPGNNFTLTLSSGYVYNQGPGTADPINFGAQQTAFKNLSTTLANTTPTPSASCVLVSSTTTCTALAAGLNIINVTDPTMLGTGKSVNINLGTNSYVVINVAGTTDTMTGNGFTVLLNGVSQGQSNGDSTTTLAHNILFNYYQATGLSTNSIVGSLLAPLAAVNGTSGQIDGTLVANSFTGSLEFHNFGFEGNLPSSAAPEPGTYVLVGVGLIGFVGLNRKRNKK